jgi:uncharacterized protein YjbI with pentapeptide repeats
MTINKDENKMEIKNFEEENHLKSSSQRFSDRISLAQYMKWTAALSIIIFVDYNFEEIDLLGISINSCDFRNSRFNNLNFQNCQIVKILTNGFMVYNFSKN